MATDNKRIVKNLSEFYDFNNQTIIIVGAGGGQFIAYGYMSKKVYAIDNNEPSLYKLKNKLLQTKISDKFTLIYSDFCHTNLIGEVVFFEFCLHEMKDPVTALKHAQTMAPNILIADHWPGSEWAYMVALL